MSAETNAEQTPPPQGSDQPRVVLDDTTRKTYRYLRASIVAMTLLLGVSLLLEILWGDGERFGSISGYYYSPVRSIFVGTLVAIGPALIAIKGRRGWEDVLMDLAGMLIPVVALVPTPRELGPEICGAGRDTCVPPELVPSVANNVAALLVLGALVIAFAWWTARNGRDAAASRGLAAAAVGWALFALWFVAGRDSFLSGAHYASAIPFFLIIAVVAYLNARAAGQREHVALLTPSRFRGAYRVVSGLMVATIVAAVALYAVSALAGFTLWFATVFLVEAILLGLFSVFWVLQTAENWDEEAVEDVGGAPVGSGSGNEGQGKA